MRLKMTSMKAVRIHSYGGTEVLRYEESSVPATGKDEVLIRVHASAVNPFDCAVRAGYVTAWYNYPFPLVPGLDISGVVADIGADVKTFASGDAVYARADLGRLGAYAEYVVVNATEVAAKPKSLDYTQAAAIPHVALTAWRALIDAASLAKGQRVLIHGAAGGVGSIAVQLAKWRGAEVIGTASRNNLDFLRELGVDQVIDYASSRFEDTVKNVDAVLDTVGGETQERTWSVLKPGGILLSVVQPPSEETAAARGVRQQLVGAYPPAAPVLAEIATLVESGKVKPVISTILPLQEIQRAHAQSETRHTRGKIVLQVMN
jgi:NADPH:quinone reductase-like Zn-dependent oxidoreductase